jgi:hypothetical protein
VTLEKWRFAITVLAATLFLATFVLVSLAH